MFVWNSLERVKTSLNHKEPDRVPFDLGSSAVTGINIKTLIKLRKHLGLSNDNIKLYDIVTQTGIVDDDLIDRLNIDVKGVDPNSVKELDVWTDGGNRKLIDELGIGWRMPIRGGQYFDLYHSPLSSLDSVEEINNYPWPDIEDPVRYKGMGKKAENITHVEKKAYILGRHFAGMWETAMWMTGYEKFFMDMVQNKKLVHAIMSKILENKMGYWERALEEIGDTALIISTADDLATQRGLLVSLELYKEMIWPYHKRLFEFIKNNFSWKRL